MRPVPTLIPTGGDAISAPPSKRGRAVMKFSWSSRWRPRCRSIHASVLPRGSSAPSARACGALNGGVTSIGRTMAIDRRLHSHPDGLPRGDYSCPTGAGWGRQGAEHIRHQPMKTMDNLFSAYCYSAGGMAFVRRFPVNADPEHGAHPPRPPARFSLAPIVGPADVPS
jgi:hypothetical protein